MYDSWSSESQHGFDGLIDTAVDEIFYCEANPIFRSDKEIDWTNAVIIKGELLLKVLLEIFTFE
jgi:hypothetical protein